MNQIYLSLGSNLGERLMNLEQAITSLTRFCPVTAVSPIYQTSPWGVTEQPAFLNMCAAATTNETPHDLLAHLKHLEAALGRQITYQWGPRIIDIDILFYNDWIINDEQLTIPHLHLAERAFVLVPLADIAPDFRHPQLHLTISQLLQQVDTYTVTPFAEIPFQTALEQ